MSITKEAMELLAECAGSTQRTAEVLFPDRFTRPWTDLHLQIFDLLDNSDNPRKAIIAPRGIGKTSISNLLLPAKAALFLEKSYIIPISASSTLATQQSENLKYELLSSPIIKALFGDMRTDKFNQEQWVLKVGGIGGKGGKDICIMPRGAGQQVRGILYRGARMDLGIADDLEDPEHMDSEEMRTKKKKWFYNDFMKAVDNYARPIPWEIIVVNTLLHQDSLAADLIDNPDWDVLELEICDDNLKSKIPEWLSDEEIKEVYEIEVRAGNISGFFREYRNKPNVGGAHAVFDKKNFKYYEEKDFSFEKDPDVDTFVIIDPAKTSNPKNAETGIVGVSANYRTNAIYVRDVMHGHWHPDETINQMFAMQIRLQADVIGLEVTGLNEYATYPVKNEMIRRGLFLNFVELHARGGDNEKGKIKRIKGLAPLYRLGLIYHNSTCCDALEAQLMSFPFSKRWDIMDALAYIVELLEKGERYMLPLDVHGKPLPPEHSEASAKQLEREFRDLMSSYGDDDLPLRNFRVI